MHSTTASRRAPTAWSGRPSSPRPSAPKDLDVNSALKENARICSDDTDAYFETTRRVEAGEELLTLYGEDYKRDYPSPYEWLAPAGEPER